MGQLDLLYDQMAGLTDADEESKLLASASPLLLAMHMDRSIKAFPHMRHLDDHILSLCNLQLYPNGPGEPPDVWARAEEGQGDWTKLGTGYSVAISDAAFDATELVLCRPGAAERSNGPENVPNEDKVVYRIAVAFPPRHGKSTIITENLPQWFLLRYPTNSVVVSTFNATAAEKWGRSCQERFRQNGYKYPTASDGQPLTPITSSVDNISFRPGKDTGEISYRGFGGVLTGTGWGLGIIDDPFKDQSDSFSEAERKAKREWYSSTFRSRPTRRRGSPPPLEVMVFTRWHEEDLAGVFAYEEDGETAKPGWCVLRLPALAEDDDPLGRPVGASLCPQLVPLSFLLNQQEISPSWFASLYQGRPTHESGNMFGKTFEELDGKKSYWHWEHSEGYYRRGDGLLIDKDKCLYYMISDWATSLKTSADWSVISLWAWDTEHKVLLLVDRIRGRISSESHRSWAYKFWTDNAHLSPMYLGVEDKTFGTSLINEMRQEFPDVTIIPLKADKDKVSRAIGYSEAVKAGRVLFPHPRFWTATVEWENEHALFPNGKHDDQVDTGGYAWIQAHTYAVAAPPKEEFVEPTPYQKAAQQIERAKSGRHPYHDLATLIRRMTY